MKLLAKSISCCTSLCLLAGTALAQTSQDQPSSSSSSSSSSSQQPGMSQSGQSQQFYHAKDLIGKSAKDTQGQKVGSIHDLIFNPQNGETFAAIGVGSGRYALVPWQAMSVTGTSGKEEVTLNTSKDKLQSAPTVKSDEWQNLNNPSFTQSIYSHYNLQPPSAMGGAATPGGSSSGGSSTTPSKPDSSTGQ